MSGLVRDLWKYLRACDICRQPRKATSVPTQAFHQCLATTVDSVAYSGISRRPSGMLTTPGTPPASSIIITGIIWILCFLHALHTLLGLQLPGQRKLAYALLKKHDTAPTGAEMHGQTVPRLHLLASGPKS